MRRKFIAALIITASLASPAGAFVSREGQVVVSDGPDTFTVPFRGRSAATDFWCAAGRFSSDRLRLPANQVIYRTSEPPRGSGQGISFSLRPEDQASRTGVAVFGGRASGGGMSVGSAVALCDHKSFNRRGR
jgi:hypothetical protein